MKADEIRKVLIIGAGTMGHQIGFICALHGLDVNIYDIDSETLSRSIKRIRDLAKSFVNSGGLAQDKMEEVISRIKPETDPEKAAAGVDFVSESVPEDPNLKGEIFSKFHPFCPEHAIFTTNTSSLVCSMFAHKTGRPEKFLAFHFHDVRFTRIVDIMPHPNTSKETVETVKEFAKRIGQIPIVLKKENFGYVFNAMLMELLKSAQTLAANDVAGIKDIDRAWMGVMHTQIGPFGLMDSIGLDTVWKITDYWANVLNDPQAKANAAFLKKYVDKGLLGVKTGKGFYAYPDPEFSQPGFIEKGD